MEKARQGFTLIEMSIVLVIIGLIVGGVLVGQDLIRAAAVRATISQIEKYNAAANTFFGKYGYLPGDIPAVPAAQFGFAARGTLQGEGDGNGLLEGGNGSPYGLSFGEPAMFWVDLSAANLIDGTFNSATSTGPAPALSMTQFAQYFPPAKLGNGNFLLVVPAALGQDSTRMIQGANYYAIVALTGTNAGDGNALIYTEGMTVKQAYDIDQKIDDGLPLSGRVTGFGEVSGSLPNTNAAQAGSPTTCWDNNNVQWATMYYSVAQNGGAGVNCEITIQMQAGD